MAARAVLRPWLLERSLDRLAMPLLDLVLKDKNQYTEKFIADALDRPKQPASMEMARVMSDLVPDLIHASVLDRAHCLRMPVLLMWGDSDRLIPKESAQILQQRLRAGRLVMLPGCGHMPMIERPEVVTHEIERFLPPIELFQRKAA